MQKHKKSHREELLLTQLKKRKWVSTHDAAKLLGVSECTVRRLFTELERTGEAVRSYGGIKPVDDGERIEYVFDSSQMVSTDEKRRIGERGSRLVESGDVFYIDNGTTMQQMALSLVKRLNRKELRNIQVYTNSLKNLTILSKYCDVNLVGGLFREHRQDFCGHLSEQILGTVSFRKCFLGADGVDFDADDIMATDIFTARINEIVAERAASVCLLADSSKFTRRSFIRYADIGQVNMVITDRQLDQVLVEKLLAQGCRVELV